MNTHCMAELIRLAFMAHPIVGDSFKDEYVRVTGTAGIAVNFVHIAAV